MITQDKSEHFVPLEDILVFDASTPVLDVYRELGEKRRGGFILRDADQERFVNAEELAQRSIIEPTKDFEEIVSETSETIGQLCESPAVISAITDIEPYPIEADADAAVLQAQIDDKVYMVSSGVDPTGYFFNHEAVLDPATKRVLYVCEYNHRNPDPDHGTCYRCPGRIVRTERE